MKKAQILFAAVIVTTGVGVLLAQRPAAPARAPRPGIDWPAFRGIDANGVVTEGRPAPTTFTPASAAWRTKIPGLGNSSPIVWGDLLCVTTAISEKDNSFKPGLYGNIEPVNDSSPHEWKVICLDKRTGATRWEQTVHKGVPAVKRHPKSTQANATLATDGTHLAAFFGSEGPACLRPLGQAAVEQELRRARLRILRGTGSSVGIRQLADHPQRRRDRSGRRAEELVPRGIRRRHRQGTLARGAQRRADLGNAGDRRRRRPQAGRRQRLEAHRRLRLRNRPRALEADRRRRHPDTDADCRARPDLHHERARRTNRRCTPFARPPRATSRSRATRPATRGVAWSVPRAGSYMATPLLYGDYLYVMRWNGILGVYEARTGTRAYQQRLGQGATAFTASPVASGGHIYFATEDGEVYVIKAGPTFELVATNKLDAAMLATPAISEGRLFIRTKDEILAFGN